MPDRRVTHVKKGDNDEIIALCNPVQAWWSQRFIDDVIADIENNRHTYYVEENGHKVDIHVVESNAGKYLRTDPDSLCINNLSQLPELK